MIFKQLIKYPFSRFNRNALTKKECEVLDGGIVKHTSILRVITIFLIPQFALAIIAPEIFILLSAVSFVSMMLGTAWYTISFQNISEDQLDAGVADFITKKMFRAFCLSFNTLVVCALTFMAKTCLPEIKIPQMAEINIWIRSLILGLNACWLIIVWVDVYFASVTYDAADSLLGDGFPTLMRGAKANHKNSPLVKLLRAIAEKMGIDINEVLGEKKEEE